MAGRRGSILIITLWILAILVILSIGIGGRMALELKLTAFNRDNAVALYLAKAGVKRAMAVIAEEDHGVDTLKEIWSNNDESRNPLFKEIKVGNAGSFTVAYSCENNKKLYGFQDEESRVNINSAPPEVISRLITYLDSGNPKADEIANNIKDWRDEGKSGPNGYLDVANELLLVKGIDKVLFDKIKDYITVYPLSGSAGINVNTAPAPVLSALGFKKKDIDSIIALRSAETDYVTFDQKNFWDFFDIDNLPEYEKIRKLVVYGSNYFRVVSTGSSANGRAHRTVTAVVSTEGEILFWYEE